MKLIKLNRAKLSLFCLLVAVLCLCACNNKNLATANSKTASITKNEVKIPQLSSLMHFNHLYKEITIAGKKMAVINIYSEYPDYSFAIEPAEGFACVDDVARGVIMLSNRLAQQEDETVLYQLKLLTEFVLYMQNENGYFNNFIWHDLSKNITYKTSTANFNWWSLRALWSLQASTNHLINDADLTVRINNAINRVVDKIKQDSTVTSQTTQMVNSITLPTWLPQKYGADQAALAIIALLPYYQNTKDPQVLAIINAFAKGIMLMQKGDEKNYPYGMFLSWKNQWHSWGNSQAYALLLAGKQLDNPEYIKSALLEVDNFYPYLLKHGFAESIWIKADAGKYIEERKKSFPQITYGIRPMVYAASEAYKVTKDDKYLALQTKLQSWLFANNDAGTVIHNIKNGRTYDAIKSADELNLNSGAESTIEALLILQKNGLQQNNKVN